MLAMDMVENTLQDQEEEDATSSFRQEIIINAIQGHDSQQSMSSLSTIANTITPVNLGALALRDEYLAEHELIMTDRKVVDSRLTRTMRQRCSLCQKKTPYHCAACQSTGNKLHYWLCNGCVADHKAKVALDYDELYDEVERA